MILSAWKPKTKVIDGKQTIIHYELLEDFNKINSNTRVIWVCDNENCKKPEQKHSISASHLNPKKSKHNTLEKQFCHSCQMSGENNPMFGNTKTLKELMNDDDKYNQLIQGYSERWSGDKNISHREDVKKKKKQFIINKKNLNELVNNNNEVLISYTGNNKNCLLEIECVNGHIRKQKYHSYNKGRGCVECFWESMNIKEIDKESYSFYKKMVYHYTRKSIKINKINEGVDVGNNKNQYHLDHKFSISKGFKLGILPSIIGSIVNLEYIPNVDNLKKLDNCSITIDDLFESYDIYNKIKK